MKNLQNKTTILIIENDSDRLTDVRSMLREVGYDVLTAIGGDQGFCTARRIQPDLILSETVLPDLSGVQLCYMIRADKKLRRVPFILLGETSDQNSKIAAEGLRAGADDYLEKNCGRQFLEAKIARLIVLRRSEIELLRRRQTLRRSESHLAKIIADTSNLVAALDPAQSSAALNSYDALRLRSFFRATNSPKKHLFRKTGDASEIWNPLLPADDFIETKQIGSQNREKIYYEVVR